MTDIDHREIYTLWNYIAVNVGTECMGKAVQPIEGKKFTTRSIFIDAMDASTGQIALIMLLA